MKRSVLAVAVVLCLGGLVLATGCKKRPPATTDEDLLTETMEAPADDITDAPFVDTVDDITRAIMDDDLQRLNALLAERGLVGDVYFDYDNFDLKPDARERLSRNSEFMREQPNLVFTIEGHCDERGTNEYNLALGDRRANAAKNYLMSLGVPATQLQTISYGEERPTCTQSNESCWSRNRRAHFLVTGQSS